MQLLAVQSFVAIGRFLIFLSCSFHALENTDPVLFMLFRSGCISKLKWTIAWPEQIELQSITYAQKNHVAVYQK